MLTTDLGEDEALILENSRPHRGNRAESMTVEEIQDRVEVELMKSPRKEVAKIYRIPKPAQHCTACQDTRHLPGNNRSENNDITRENANMNTDSPAGMMMKFASETTKPFVDDYLLSEEAREAVRGGYIHIHDKDYYPTKSLTCVQHPLEPYS